MVLIVGCTKQPVQEKKRDAPVEDVALGVSEKKPEIQENAIYTLDREQSTLHWKSARIVGVRETGTVQVRSGKIEKKEGIFQTGQFVIDMTTIADDKRNSRLEHVLKSATFFDVEVYPVSTLSVTAITPAGGKMYTVVGDLMIMNKTHEISFPATVHEAGNKMMVDARFDIDRTEWGIIYDSGSFIAGIGNKAIKDYIDFTLDLVFVKK